MRHVRRVKATLGLLLAFSTLLGSMVAVTTTGGTIAQAVPSTQEYQQKVQDQADLKKQLSGVSSALANQILELNDLTDNQIPAAEEALSTAEDAAEQAQSQAAATAERLKAAEDDKTQLEEKIRQTGIDYDDAKEAVAQLARGSFHGSDASETLTVATDSSTVTDFVDKMQAEAAVTRTEAEAASDAAGTLNTSMNRKQRLASIEKQIAELKRQQDEQAAEAQKAVQAAQAKKASLAALREKGTAARAQLQQQKGSLTTAAAKQAAQIVEMKSEIDANNQKLAAEAAAAQADPSSGGSQQTSSSSSSSSSSKTSSSSGRSSRSSSSSSSKTSSSGGSSSSSSSSGASGMSYSVPGNCAAGASYCYGHATGNTGTGTSYPTGQCTRWAYIRRTSMGLPVGSYLGNGAQWASSARALGYLVNRTPHVGAVMVVAAGQAVIGTTYTWYASATAGHVAVVEAVFSNGTIYISEGGSKTNNPSYQTIVNPGSYWYIHY